MCRRSSRYPFPFLSLTSSKGYPKPRDELVAEPAHFAVDGVLLERSLGRAEDEADRGLDPAFSNFRTLVAVHDADGLEVGELHAGDEPVDLVPARLLGLREGQVRFDRRIRGVGLEPRGAR